MNRTRSLARAAKKGKGSMVSAKLDPDAFVEAHRTALNAVTNAETRAVLERLGRAIAAREQPESKPQPKPEQKSAKVIQLPLWPESQRGGLNPVFRSALFAAVQPNKRRFLNNELIATLDGVEIRFHGKQLTQKHLDTWLQVLHLARQHPAGNICAFTAHGFLKAQGLPTGKEQHERLHRELLDLRQTIQLTCHGKTYFGGLIHEGMKDEITRHYAITINPRLAAFFADDYTLIDWEQRKRLGSKYLAKWLQCHYATHAAPFPYSVTRLHELSGSEDKTLYSFRQKLRSALKTLEDIHSIETWEIDANDLVHVKRGKAISDSQQRYLTRPKAARKRKK